MTDRRFGVGRKFGTSTKFGASTVESKIAWGIEVDWDGDGIFDGSNESSNLCGINVSRGRTSMLKDAGDGFEQIANGRAVLTLWNSDGRYDAWNADSALYPNVGEERDVRITVRDFATGAIEPVFYGTISDVVPTGYDERPKVVIYVDDGWVFLRGYAASVGIQASVSPDTAIGLVLDDIGWPTRWGRNLDAAPSDTIPYWWASGDKKGGAVCEDLANSFFGNFFVDASGQARYVTRSTVASSVADFDQSQVRKDIGNPRPRKNKRTVMRIKVHPREASGTVTLYTYFGEAPSIVNGESLPPLWANYTYNGVTVPAGSIIEPVPTTDYTMNTSSDGSGTDKTADCTVTVTNFGDRGKIVVTNNSGVTVYVTKLNLRGVAIYEQNAADIFYPRDPSTVTQAAEFVLDLLWQQNPNTAQDFCDVYGPFFATSNHFPVIEIESRFALQFGKELFDIATFTSSRLGIDGQSFRIGGIEHASEGDNCQKVITRFYLEPYISGDTYMTWPGVWDDTTVFGS